MEKSRAFFKNFGGILRGVAPPWQVQLPCNIFPVLGKCYTGVIANLLTVIQTTFSAVYQATIL